MDDKPKNANQRRNDDLALIHIAKKELGLPDEEYRFLMRSVCDGIDSAAKLDYMGRQKLIIALRSLGWQPGKPGEEKPPEKRKKHKGQAAKIWAMWLDLADQGEVHNKSAQALNSFIKKQVGVDLLDWLTPAQCNQVIEALKSWQVRALQKGGK